MEQIVNIPTRMNRILDVILTNNVNMFSHHRTIINEIFSDHNSIVSYLNLKSERSKSEVNTAHLYSAKVKNHKVMNTDPVLRENYEQLMFQKCWFMEKKGANTIDEKVNI